MKTYFDIAVLAFAELSAEEKATFLATRLGWATTRDIREENTCRESIVLPPNF